MRLEADLAEQISKAPGTFGVYARNLGTGEIVGVDADRVMDTASAAKAFILVHYARLVAAGTADPDRRVEITAEDVALGSGIVRFLASGLQLTMDDLAFLMIIVSDNVCTDVLLREVGGADAVNATMDVLGLPAARVNAAFERTSAIDTWKPFGTSTPHDLAEIYSHLDERCRRVLARQQSLDGLPRRLPHANQTVDWGFSMPVRVFLKGGGDPGIYTDAGRFETDAATWVAAFMASDLQDLLSPDGAGPTSAGAVGALLYDAWAAQ